MGPVGLQAGDYVDCGFDRADVILCIGYDMVEYHPWLWHPTKDRKIVHIDASPAEVDESYIVEVGVIGNIAESLRGISALAQPHQGHPFDHLRRLIVEENQQGGEDRGFPLKPQKIIWDLRKSLAAEDIVICDVGAHKIWMARMYEAERPNTCIISNGFAAMGIAVPGAIAAKHSFPHRKVVAVTGDAGFLMNSQEIETAMRLKTPIVILIWNDQTYGLIKWKQINRFNRPSHVDFANPDFLLYAKSFGAKGYRIQAAEELLPALQEALAQPTVTLIDCPVDYNENLKLTEKLGKFVCPI